MQRILLTLIIGAIFWFQGVKPIVADYFNGKKDFTQALQWAPDDSMLQLRNGNIIRVIETNNGDLTSYALYFQLAVRMLQQGSKEGGMEAIRRSLYYYPDYDQSRRLLQFIQSQDK